MLLHWYRWFHHVWSLFSPRRRLLSWLGRRQRLATVARRPARPGLEALEGRIVPSGSGGSGDDTGSNKAAASITINPYTVTYDGTSYAATG